MFKKLTIAAILAAVALTTVHKQFIQENMAGGFKNVSLKDFANLEQDEMFAKAYKLARSGL